MGCIHSSEEFDMLNKRIRSLESTLVNERETIESMTKLHEKARVEIESLNSKNRTLSNQKIVIVDFDSTDELSSEQFELVQKCFGISKADVTHYLEYRRLLRLYGPAVLNTLSSIASNAIERSVAATEKRKSIVNTLPGIVDCGAAVDEPTHNHPASKYFSKHADPGDHVDHSKLARYYGMDGEAMDAFVRQKHAILQILKRLGEVPDLHELDLMIAEAHQLKEQRDQTNEQ